jgi:antitoxin CptB
LLWQTSRRILRGTRRPKRLRGIRKDLDMDENRDTRLRRLVYQSSYTGMKETDLLLGRFSALHLAGLSDAELDQYEALLEAGDDRIYAWVVAGEPAPEVHDNRVLDLIKEFKND